MLSGLGTLRILVALPWLLFLSHGHGEELHGVGPLDNLGDVKKRYPNAVFTRVPAAWVTESKAFYSMEGKGFPGTLYVAFDDYRPAWRKQLAKLDAPNESGTTSLLAREDLERLANQSDEEALEMDWVRWVPPQPIPLTRYKSKFGDPTKCDFGAADMRPYCEWSHRNLTVNLSDDQREVLSVEAMPTRGELRAAYLAKHSFVPEWLRESTAPVGATSPEKRTPEGKRASKP